MVAATGQVHQQNEFSAPYMVVPQGHAIKEVPFEREAPLRIEESPRFADVASFAAYVNRYKTDATLLFADRGAGRIEAQLDYHLPGAPSHNTHSAKLPVQFSEEFTRWNGACGVRLSQEQLALLLDERIDDIRDPAGAEVLSTIQNFGLRRTATLKSAINLNNNAVQLNYEETDAGRGGGAVLVPTSFVLGLPIYEGGKAYKVEVRLRYAVRDGAVTFTLTILKRTALLKDAFEAELASAEKATGLKAMLVL
jgi:uncharacterized protein YfdQ (DUF2303 family)